MVGRGSAAGAPEGSYPLGGMVLEGAVTGVYPRGGWVFGSAVTGVSGAVFWGAVAGTGVPGAGVERWMGAVRPAAATVIC